jgi:hypothetical protein
MTAWRVPHRIAPARVGFNIDFTSTLRETGPFRGLSWPFEMSSPHTDVQSQATSLDASFVERFARFVVRFARLRR